MNWRYFLYAVTHPLLQRTYLEPDGLDWAVSKKNVVQAFVDDSVAYGARVAWENLWYTLTVPPTQR